MSPHIKSMVSSESKYDQWKLGDYQFTQLEEDGYIIFNNEVGDCFHCHGDLNTGNIFGAYGDLQFSNNGLDSVLKPITGYEVVTLDSNDRGKFKIPSLRNVEYSFPYMHDGRFSTLQEVIEHYNSGIQNHPNLGDALKDDNEQPIQLNLTEQEKTDLVNFLETLTDEQITRDIKFSSPF